MKNSLLIDSPLGKSVDYNEAYSPSLLYPIPRKPFRELLNINDSLPFYGYDLWNAYEFSWLNEKGKPISAIAQFLFPCDSLNIIEAKSFKLYLNSFHQTSFANLETLTQILSHDLGECVQARVLLEIAPVTEIGSCELIRLSGICLDQLDITVDIYKVEPALLAISSEIVEETVYTDIFKSNCLATGQPDWGSVQIVYQGPKINHEQLLKYLISYRQHQEFNEHCVERIFTDIQRCCQPRALTVMARFTRRGGLDTNPCRSTDPDWPIDSSRCFRQ